jgi:hypothetical protein
MTIGKAGVKLMELLNILTGKSGNSIVIFYGFLDDI